MKSRKQLIREYTRVITDDLDRRTVIDYGGVRLLTETADGNRWVGGPIETDWSGWVDIARAILAVNDVISPRP